MTITLILAAIVMICCVFFNKISDRIGLPVLLLFIFLGMLFGSDGILKISFDNFNLAEKISECALLVIIFYGGFGTNWSKAKKSAGKSLLLSSVGVIMTAGLVGIFVRFVLGFSWAEGLLLGAVISSTDAASVFSILRGKRLNLKYGTASMLELESGSNDPWAYMMTSVILSVMRGNSSALDFVQTLFCQIFFGIAFGAVISFLAVFVMKKINLGESGLDAVFVCAAALLSYGLPSAAGGNGFLSAYIVGIVLGNSKISGKKNLVHFFDGITGITQIMLFFMLGLLSFPSQMPKIILPAAAVAAFLTLVARPLSVFTVLKPFKAPLNQIALVSFSGLRGATSIVFAIMVTADKSYTSFDIFHIVFMIVLISIGIQGTLLPFFARKANMIDNSENVLKTFSDYSEETDLNFIRLKITRDDEWAFREIRELTLPKGMLIALIIRGETSEKIIPDGNTQILENDILVLCGEGFYDDSSFILREIILDNDSEYVGKTLGENLFSENKLVVIIKRGKKILVPDGNIKLKEKDCLVVADYENTAEKSRR